MPFRGVFPSTERDNLPPPDRKQPAAREQGDTGRPKALLAADGPILALKVVYVRLVAIPDCFSPVQHRASVVGRC